ncbi:toxin HicA [Candidatus Desantisbacteria bacterium CG_4_10_14_0_8_um_filter_48_22]|uniref:Toxin HicA n=1 Tax=Candidatus Desantisbacteria bacterium CG_4_10_14_0_8_um_filter_48_22 TaxID=1974543 RepID=A0A2M7SD95_9BACT|nr:MAG: toxin HicA [Candidatus Desantisbacteria bacterium CG1_02_49_89]PIV57370.1 MAG: toxin HicA [Candidatus Desantisbacteria bacterium CG02_land_8_20_14_3_00_49_13]PIZ17454.1 MAG: toxin HicA [Candidatus Desantisbacteria bacterium CG_4_10_14_0_8_um_filter_48_22]PJB27916.1 MAG: toxin HicA [Candidatus Desantisbacteria bacterium CG_4_9_14_3_um_filter_50_7]
MIQYKKFLIRILQGNSDSNISFMEMCLLLDRMNFDERIRGSHHIFTRDDIAEILNLQPKGAKAKPYQVKQVRNIILKHKLGGKNV